MSAVHLQPREPLASGGRRWQHRIDPSFQRDPPVFSTPALSAALASTAEGAVLALERTAGNRPDTVQHVVGERNEQ